MLTRRTALRWGLTGGALLALGPVLTSCRMYDELGAPDANGLRLPPDFTSRVIATSGQTVGATGQGWHFAPDGGATFPAPDGGWIYVSNCELDSGFGGASMVRFDSAGDVVDAKRILNGTRRNCAGGATPWGTWLSCEEVSRGAVYECDPFGLAPAVRHDAMGWFNHEAAAVDPTAQVVYLSEDQSNGGLYRFVPDAYPDLSAGTLEVLVDDAGALTWVEVPNPNPTAAETSTRSQVPNMRVFNGGEGLAWNDGKLYLTTKGDNRVWTYTPATNSLAIIYDAATLDDPVLTGVDNVTVTPRGDVYVAEDGGNMQICLLFGKDLKVPQDFLELTGVSGSEMTGPAFDPSGTRLYFSSQWNPGRTYEVTGPFRSQTA
jgi:secreted PhoX family phosphatase